MLQQTGTLVGGREMVSAANLDEHSRPTTVRVPRGLLFPVTPHGPISLDVRTVNEEGDRYTLQIGGVSPLGCPPEVTCAPLSFRHQRLIFRIISLSEREFESPEIRLRYSDLIDTEGHVQRVSLRRTLAELGNTWMHRRHGDRVDAVRLLEYNPEIYYQGGEAVASERNENIEHRLLRCVRFADDFWRAFHSPNDCHNVRTNVISQFSSNIAAASYLVLDAMAYHRGFTDTNKGTKDAAELLREVGATVPEKPSELRRVFERRRGSAYQSILQSLSGTPTANGYLCVDEELEQNTGNTAFNVRFWRIRSILSNTRLKHARRDYTVLRNLWTRHGLSPRAFESAQNVRWRRVEDCEREQLLAIGYPLEHNLRFLELVRSFIGPARFGELIHAVNKAVNDPWDPVHKTVDRWLNTALREAFEAHAESTRSAEPKRGDC